MISFRIGFLFWLGLKTIEFWDRLLAYFVCSNSPLKFKLDGINGNNPSREWTEMNGWSQIQ